MLHPTKAGVTQADGEDPIHKATGWLLREAGKTDMPRLKRYLRENGPAMKETCDTKYKDRTRFQKLGVKPHWRVSAIGVDDRAFLAELEDAVALLSIGRTIKDSDAIFFAVTKERQLPRIEKLKAALKPNGAILTIRPKGRAEISEASVMAAGQAAGLVDVKVVSFSPTHTAEKFVIPVKSR